MSDSDNLLSVHIDRDKCVGHGRCYSLAPEVYDSDDEGFSELTDGVQPVPALYEQARLGASACPEDAIEVTPR